jgi:hypothetical protein
MLGPVNTAADVALLLEEGLRERTIVLSRPENLHQHPGSRGSWRFRTRLVQLSAEVALAVVCVLVLDRIHIISHAAGLAVIIAGPLALVGFRHLVNALDDIIDRRTAAGTTTRHIDRV